MFLHILSQEEKTAIIGLITAIARADGDITDSEKSFIENYAAECDLSCDLSSDVNLEKACSLLQTPKAKIVAIQEIIKIALADGHFDSTERAGAIAISNMLSLPIEKFEEVEDWVLEGQRWVEKGEQMVSTA